MSRFQSKMTSGMSEKSENWWHFGLDDTHPRRLKAHLKRPQPALSHAAIRMRTFSQIAAWAADPIPLTVSPLTC
jgi:hypothetical protein